MPDPIAPTTTGPVRGTDHGRVLSFKGIPFAAPPVGQLRHRPPVPHGAWTEPLDATAYGPVCPQVAIPNEGALAALGTPEEQDEDCLRLNVWTPALDDARRPVMVWIHGGAFTAGSGSTPLYDGTTFARDGVVTVSINYRLHALGFLYLDDLFPGAEGTGNLGILDQVAALEWVRDNIAAFGGDPGNVTIFGESAGGMSVGTLLGTPAAAGLFRRAIPQSGAAHHSLTTAAATRITRRVLELLEVEPGDWDALAAVPVDRLVAVAAQVGQLEGPALLAEEASLRMGFLPVVDGKVLSKRAIDSIAEGSAADVDVLIGYCAEEWRLFWWGLAPAMLDMIPEPDVDRYFAGTGRSGGEVMKAYESVARSAERRDVLCQIETDLTFGVPALRLADAQARAGGSVRAYRFSWRTPTFAGMIGACHALEIPFVFERLEGVESFVGPDAPAALAEAMHAAWVRFATTGDPSGPGIPEWPAYSPSQRAAVDFDEEVTVVDDLAGATYALWDGVL